MDLFQSAHPEVLAHAPLAEKLRPSSKDEMVGQEHLLQSGLPLAEMLSGANMRSVIFWGPPGCGKTTLARMLAAQSGLMMRSVSAITTGAAQLRSLCEEAAMHAPTKGATLLFVDEIHRLNRAQQDVFLPYLEQGSILLLGATTENPSFELNAALLSRTQVMALKPLSDEALEQLLKRAEAKQGCTLPLTEDARAVMRRLADGDGRYLLGMCEQIWQHPLASAAILDVEALGTLLQQRAPVYDKGQEAHYHLISALHKALRSSDTDAALYWLHRMLLAGEDAGYIARRLVRFAVEDIGLADPQALVQAQAAWQAYEQLGSPEGELALTQAVAYLGSAPKSNAVYKAHKAAAMFARQHGSLMPPLYAMNAPTKLMKEQGYSAGYEYDHDLADGCSGLNYFPPDMPRQSFYRPVERGFERDIAKRLHYWQAIRDRRRQNEEKTA